MDNNEVENYLDKLKRLQQEIPNIVLPSMGLIENDTKLNINGSDYIKQNEEE